MEPSGGSNGSNGSNVYDGCNVFDDSNGSNDRLQDARGAKHGAEGGREARCGNAEYDEVLRDARVLHHVHVELEAVTVHRARLAEDEEEVANERRRDRANRAERDRVAGVLQIA